MVGEGCESVGRAGEKGGCEGGCAGDVEGGCARGGKVRVCGVGCYGAHGAE